MPTRIPIGCRPAAFSVLMVLIGAMSIQAATPAIDWRRLECQTDPGVAGLDCGHRDGLAIVYQVDDAATGLPENVPESCSVTASSKFETPLTYPSQADTPPGSAPIPCDLGSCLCESAAACEENWIAVVDWDNWHGWSISSLIRSASESSAGVVLFDLERSTDGAPAEGVDDFKVLARLCEIVREAEVSGPPLAVNMSFGRLPPVGRGLGLEIDGVLKHLSDLGVLLLASAGNHHDLLFPASSDEVNAVGMLALADFFGEASELLPTWETPPGPAQDPPGKLEALFPGNGLCLPIGAGNGENSWPAPPGSSYATGLATGWLTLAVARQVLEFPGGDATTGGLWHPARNSSSGFDRYLLSHSGSPITGTESPFIDGLFNTMRDDGHPCWQVEGSSEEPVLGCGNCPGIHPVSLPHLVADTYSGTPDTNACVPCTGDRFVAGGGAGGDRLVLSLVATPPLPASLWISRLQLRIGDTLHDLDVPVEMLRRLELGSEHSSGVRQLVVEGYPLTNDASLVFIIEDRSISGSKAKFFWTSVPILVREATF